SELLQAFPAECQVRELLPAVSHHEITPATPAAAKVQDQPLLANRCDELGEAFPVHLPAAEDPGSDYHVRSARVEPCPRIVEVDPAADLQSPGIGLKRRASFGLVTLTEHDDVPALQPVALVKFGIPGGWMI